MKCSAKKLSGQSVALAVFCLSAHATDVSAPSPAVAAPAKAISTAKRAAPKPLEVIAAEPPAPLELKSGFAGEIELFAGETRVITEPKVARLAVGNGKILSAAVLDNKEMLLMATEPGVSSLQVWTRDGRNRRIKVTIVPESSRVSREIAAFVTTIPQVKATVIGDKVVVDGDNLSERDLSKIDELAKRYPQVVNFTNRIGWEKMVVMDVKVVEFPTTFLKEMGLKWGATGGMAVGAVVQPYRLGSDGPYQINLQTGSNNAPPIVSSGGGPIPLSSNLNVLSMINMGLNAQLNLMEQNGTATLLAQPTLSTRSGSKATFLVGGEFPYTVSNLNGTTVVFKPYGIRLEIEPRVDHTGVVRAKIMSEVSDIDTSVSSTGGPALRTRKTETEFNVREGGTIVLSGLLKRDVSSAVDKVPLLGDIPVLGALFRSKRFQNNETELVVFVTPRVTDQNSPAQEESMVRGKDRLQQTPRVGRPDLLSVPVPGQTQGGGNAPVGWEAPAPGTKPSESFIYLN
ncbi:MAG: pilus assembly protein N-terminal domain-containing protein [Pseudomonadota bacterium]